MLGMFYYDNIDLKRIYSYCCPLILLSICYEQKVVLYKYSEDAGKSNLINLGNAVDIIVLTFY